MNQKKITRVKITRKRTTTTNKYFSWKRKLDLLDDQIKIPFFYNQYKHPLIHMTTLCIQIYGYIQSYINQLLSMVISQSL
jgi:hypothetical protein